MLARAALQPCGAVAVQLLLLSQLVLLFTVANRLSHLPRLLGLA
jgi:hypothetical protein